VHERCFVIDTRIVNREIDVYVNWARHNVGTKIESRGGDRRTNGRPGYHPIADLIWFFRDHLATLRCVR
jgi:hypothetical protein